jgi:hypothetical protein
MPDQATTGLEQPLLQARQRPTLNGKWESFFVDGVAERLHAGLPRKAVLLEV